MPVAVCSKSILLTLKIFAKWFMSRQKAWLGSKMEGRWYDTSLSSSSRPFSHQPLSVVLEVFKFFSTSAFNIRDEIVVIEDIVVC
jgi:hypothetical protein